MTLVHFPAPSGGLKSPVTSVLEVPMPCSSLCVTEYTRYTYVHSHKTSPSIKLRRTAIHRSMVALTVSGKGALRLSVRQEGGFQEEAHLMIMFKSSF